MRERLIYFHVYPLVLVHHGVDYVYPFSPGNQVPYKQKPETKKSTTTPQKRGGQDTWTCILL